MRLSYKWLLDHLETELDSYQIANELTKLGLEVEKLEDIGLRYDKFSVAYVREVSPHPNADNLSVCLVDHDGDGSSQVVCGANNVRAGMKGIFAPVGSVIPDSGMKLKASKIRDVKSYGMLCSEREMNISDEHDGIIEVDEEVEVGTKFAEWRGLDDVFFELGITPNRGDCLGVYGIARDLAASGCGHLKTPSFLEYDLEETFHSDITWKIDSSSNDSCLHVLGRSFRGVSNVRSPQWLIDRLRGAGMREISALVDISNYVMLDMGRPAHIYDRKKLSGESLVMRRSRDGEEFLSLYGVNHRLPEGISVISDSSSVQAIAGIIGGELSGCQDDTRDVFLELALFDPLCVARDARELSIETDARFRFERGVDRNSCDWGLLYVSKLVKEICGGEASYKVGDGEAPAGTTKVFMSNSRVRELTGLEVSPERVEEIMVSLGFGVDKDDDGYQVSVPSWRYDVSTDSCLVEEVTRIYGIDKIESQRILDDREVIESSVGEIHQRAQAVANILANRGMFEAVSLSFCDDEIGKALGSVGKEMTIINPMVRQINRMRPSIIASLLPLLHENIIRNRKPFALFEVGPVYWGDEEDQQEIVATGLLCGEIESRNWERDNREASVFDVKESVLEVLESLKIPARKLVLKTDEKDLSKGYRVGHGASLWLGKTCLANFGLIEPTLASISGIDDKDVFGFDIFIERLPQDKNKSDKGAWSENSLMNVQRDFAFVVDEKVRAGDLLNTVRKVEQNYIQEVDLFDVFRAKEIGEGYKSLAISVLFQPREVSFTDVELEEISKRIVVAVKDKLGGELR